jgi:hypothetical protein
MREDASDPSKADIARAMVGLLSTVVVLALLWEPTVRLFIPKLLSFSAVAVACVLTAKNKTGVVLGIIAIICLRLFIGIAIFGIHLAKTKH